MATLLQIIPDSSEEIFYQDIFLSNVLGCFRGILNANSCHYTICSVYKWSVSALTSILSITFLPEVFHDNKSYYGYKNISVNNFWIYTNVQSLFEQW
jgi:hypothetical protein